MEGKEGSRAGGSPVHKNGSEEGMEGREEWKEVERAARPFIKMEVRGKGRKGRMEGKDRQKHIDNR